tara:strand:- start:1015 stop:1965 length:951 start_codon:yes stop_codon:yes gene_type:complete
MQKFEEAPYLELEDYKAPKDGNFIFIPMHDNKKIRLAYWKQNKSNQEIIGTVLLQQGHNEFIEKYYECIQVLLDKHFNVVCFDWRGQGMSDRMIEDSNKQYIEDFTVHIQDLEFIVKDIIKREFTGPLIGIGHSMGGHLLLLSQEHNQENFEAIILSAPMLGFKYEKILFFLSNCMKIFSKKDRYFLFSRPNMGKETPFEQNDLTSDFNRYIRTQKLVRKKPSIRLWGITNAWVNATKDSLIKMREKNWYKLIKTPICIVNPLCDKVVSPKKTEEMAEKLQNCKIYNIENCEHEILMEKDSLRSDFWRIFENFISL